MYIAICPSARHADNSPGTAGFDSSGPQHKALIICLLQVCYHEFVCASVCFAKWVEGDGVEKTWAKFLWKLQLNQ